MDFAHAWPLSVVARSSRPGAPRVASAWRFSHHLSTGSRAIASRHASARFTRAQRLLDAAQFSRVFRHGRRIRQGNFMATVARNDQPVARLGLAVGRKLSNRAVQRNRIKRLIRESFRHSDVTGMDVIVTATPAACLAGNAQLRADLDRLWAGLQDKR